MTEDPIAPDEADSVPPPPPPHRGGRSFFIHLLHALPVIAGVTTLTFVLAHFGFLRVFETTALDSYLRLKPPLRSEHVVIVGIDECDYLDLFRATSPLDPEILARLLTAVAAGGPRAVAVDIDTSHAMFRGLSLPPNGPPIVWARGSVAAGESTGENCRGSTREPLPDADGSREMGIVPAGVLGGHGSTGLRSGLAVLPRDADGVVRRYFRAIETSEGRLATLPWVVTRLYTGDQHDQGDEEEEEPLVLDFAGDRFEFPRMSASDVLQVARSEAWGRAGPLKDKIVLVGGLYRAARDEYITPVGPMSGAELVAQAIESELSGGGIRPANEIAMIVFELIGGVALVWLHYRFRLGLALGLSIVGIPVVSLVSSYLAFSSAARWANFVPLLIAVLVHQLYDHAREYRRLYLAASGS